jgi:hypothetical protein
MGKPSKDIIQRSGPLIFGRYRFTYLLGSFGHNFRSTNHDFGVDGNAFSGAGGQRCIRRVRDKRGDCAIPVGQPGNHQYGSGECHLPRLSKWHDENQRIAMKNVSITPAAAVMLTLISAPALAQWLVYPTAGVPRNSDGSPNLAAPAPRTAGGHPDFSGIWEPEKNRPCPPEGCDDIQVPQCTYAQ